MNFVGVMTEEDRQRLLSVDVPYVQYKGNDKDYYVGKFDKRYMWLKIPPGGFIHKHTDKAGIRRHYVLQTNWDSLLYIEDKGYHLEEGAIYDMDGRKEHWSVNNGSEDRIHYIDLKPHIQAE